MDKLHKFLFNALFVVISAPFMFFQWLLIDGNWSREGNSFCYLNVPIRFSIFL
jgi:hypothetical protein